ncbi:CD40 ligand-like [Orbicella faveolata]|uniref:CD40 ligand-like n=1 Tax=Orbicella faveolata TaxID=48498 RepID=UPI0009E19E02|nr:CD40 ligand-like [Orbicella faveolata]
MKFVLLFALLAYTKFSSGSKTGACQSQCATPCNPVNINVYGKEGLKGEKGESGTNCKCHLQDPNKPSAHIEAVNKYLTVTYQANTVIKDWSVSVPHSHLAGGMKYHDGKLTVPTSGRYYIYTQLYYLSTGRVIVRVNNNRVTMIHPLKSGTGQGALYAGGVFNLKAGDVISLEATYSTTVYMSASHSYFGAFLI